MVLREEGGDGGHWLRHPSVPRRRSEELGVVRFEAGAYCVSDLLAALASASLLKLRSSDSDRKISDETFPISAQSPIFLINK